MIDRTPTRVLANGALRYGVYDESGNLLRYEFIRPEDEPTQIGTALNKKTFLTDVTAALFGKGSDAVPDDIFALLNGRAKIETGTYIGTGTYGSANPTSLTFNFKPKAIFVFMEAYQPARHISTSSDSPSWGHTFAIFLRPALSLVAGGTVGQKIYLTWGDSGVSWYYSHATGGAGYQFNESGVTYNYIAIG